MIRKLLEHIRHPGRWRAQAVALALPLVMLQGPVLTSAAEAVPAQAAFDLARYRGKVVYLDFWASWCGPCKLSFPFMQDLRARYGPDGLVVLTVNVDHDRAAADRFLRDNGSSLPVIYDPQGVLASRYRVAGMPTTVLFDRNGKLAVVHRGFFPTKTDEYVQHVAALVGQHP